MYNVTNRDSHPLLIGPMVTWHLCLARVVSTKSIWELVSVQCVVTSISGSKLLVEFSRLTHIMSGCLSHCLHICFISCSLSVVPFCFGRPQTKKSNSRNRIIEYSEPFFWKHCFLKIQTRIGGKSSHRVHVLHHEPSRCSDPLSGKSVNMSKVIYVRPTPAAYPATSVKSRGVFLMLRGQNAPWVVFTWFFAL